MKLTRILTVVLTLLSCVEPYAQGLKFVGLEDKIENRTSYEVFSDKRPKFRNVLKIGFSLAVYPPSDFGYILRIKDGRGDRIFNLLYSGKDKDAAFPFRLNEEGKSSIIKAGIPREHIRIGNWMRIALEFDMIGGKVRLNVDDYAFEADIAPLDGDWQPEISFGKSDYFIDVPSIAIKDLKISDDRKEYEFPLNESRGGYVHEAHRKCKGTVSNPIWLLERSYKWNLEKEFSSETIAGVNYDPVRKSVFYFNRDSIYRYDVARREHSAVRTETQCPMVLHLGSSFFNPHDNCLYLYEAYNEFDEGHPTVVKYDPDSRRWTVQSADRVPARFHHHSSFFDAGRNRLFFFGGFGSMIYNGNFYSYDLDSRLWTKEEPVLNDTIFPRYFTSLAYSEKEDAVYVFGGMGNECGEQIVGRHYFYDLHRVDMESWESLPLWKEIPDWKEENMVPVRNMVLTEDGFYTVCYPEFLTNSYLQLFHFNKSDGTYRKYSDKVPIKSDKLATNANLYFDKELQLFILTVYESEDDIKSHLKIYTLSSPPLTEQDYDTFISDKSRYLGFGGLAVLSVMLTAGVILIVCHRKRKRHLAELSDAVNSKKTHNYIQEPNSICVFGDFSALGADNRTVVFPSQQKKLFCLIMEYSFEKGISSKRLSKIMWPDKEEDKVKNSRGVAMNHLRKLLGNLQGISLVFEDNCFRFSLEDTFTCDWLEFRKECGQEMPDIDRLLTLLSRGKFMAFSDDAIFDHIKEKAENTIIGILTSEMQKSYAKKQYSMVLEMADVVFQYDSLNEQALSWSVNALVKSKKTEDAMVRYSAFVSEYKKLYDADFKTDFDGLLK